METTWCYEATDVQTRQVFTGEVQATDMLNAVYRANQDPALPKGRGYSVRVWEKPMDAPSSHETSLGPRVNAELTRRFGIAPGDVFNRDLGRYYEALRQARAALRQQFDTPEISAILDTLNGHWFAEPESVAWIPAEVEDAIGLNDLDRKWQVDADELLRKLGSLSFMESCALADAAERFWRRVGQGEHDLRPEAALDEEG
jgi:hypothetical protein